MVPGFYAENIGASAGIRNRHDGSEEASKACHAFGEYV